MSRKKGKTDGRQVMDQQALWERAERLRSAADNTGSQVRNVYFTFLLLAAYIAVIIGSTTDEQLLKASPVTLPILNVGLPIVGFYAFVPWLLLFFHFNLLLQFYFLARMLHPLDAAISILKDDTAQAEQRARLFALPFSHMLIGRDHARVMRVLLALLVWITVILLPLILLLWAQIRFLPSHNGAILVSQRTALALDLIFIWIFWPMIVGQSGHARDWWARIIIGPIRWMRGLYPFGRGLNMRQVWTERAHGLLTLTLTTFAAATLSLFIAVLPNEPMEEWIVKHVPESWRVKPERRGGSEYFRLTYLLFDAPGAPFHRNLRLAGKVLVAGEPSVEVLAALQSDDDAARAEALQQIAGLRLMNRDLRFADLRHAILPKVDLRGASLDGADLKGADLSHADLRPFDITERGQCLQEGRERSLEDEVEQEASELTLSLGLDAKVCPTSMQWARLADVSLTGARLPFAELQAANLGNAKLRDANLAFANLQDGKLAGARLEKARLKHTNLQDAILRNAELREADLTHANLRNGNLGHAKLQETNLEDADLQGADLTAAELQGTRFSRAKLNGVNLAKANLIADVILKGANLRRLNLQGVDLTAMSLEKAELQGANLRRAQMAGVRLNGAQLKGAILIEADLRGANLRRADLQGADLEGASLQGARLYDAKLNGADLRGANLGGGRFSRADLSLSDLRGISRKPLRQKEYERLQENMNLQTNILERLQKKIDKPDNLQRVSSAEDAICDAPSLFETCLSKTEDYYAKLIPWLVALSCGDPDVAYGIAVRAVTEYTTAGRHDRNGKRIMEVDSLGRLLAAGLLATGCEAMAALPEKIKEKLTEAASWKAPGRLNPVKGSAGAK